MNLNGPLDIQRGLEDNKPDAAPRRADRRRWTGRLPVLGLVLLLVTTLAFGAWSHYEQHRQVIATAEQSRDLVPEVRVASVQPGDSVQIVSLPATTSAFAGRKCLRPRQRLYRQARSRHRRPSEGRTVARGDRGS
jgi:hypothetical protein